MNLSRFRCHVFVILYIIGTVKSNNREMKLNHDLIEVNLMFFVNF